MPAPTDARVRRNGDALVFTGALLRAHVPALWQAAQPLRAGARRLDVSGVQQIDSAGLALLAELGTGDGADLAVDGMPAGLAELRAAYRLDDRLAFAR